MTVIELSQVLGNFGEFFGAIAVVGTLIYLAIQIRQNTRSMDENRRLAQAQVYQERAYDMQDMFMRKAESESLNEIEEKLEAANFPENPEAMEVVSAVQRRRYLDYLFAQGARFDNQLYQYEQGLLDELPRRAVQAIRRRWLPRFRAFGIPTERFDERSSFRELSLPDLDSE